jgi:hypothetical protein
MQVCWETLEWTVTVLPRASTTPALGNLCCDTVLYGQRSERLVAQQPRTRSEYPRNTAMTALSGVPGFIEGFSVHSLM